MSFGGTPYLWDLSLPGGASVSLPVSGGTQSWSYPNLHGDSILTADSAGVRVGVRATYDPFGQPIDSVTGCIGTLTADDSVADNSPGEADYAWVGGARKLLEHQGSIATIEMGVRQCVAALGRFLSVDPVEGGVSNSYDYPADPINRYDLTGEMTADRYQALYDQGRKPIWIRLVRTPMDYLVNPSTPRPKAAIPAIVGPRPQAGAYFSVECAGGPCPPVPGGGVVGVNACAGVCVEGGAVLDQDGRLHAYLGGGIGLRLGAGLQLGGTVGAVGGVDTSITCEGSVGPLGVYGQFAVSPGAGQLSGPSLGGGFAPGAEVGCALMTTYTW